MSGIAEDADKQVFGGDVCVEGAGHNEADETDAVADLCCRIRLERGNERGWCVVRTFLTVGPADPSAGAVIQTPHHA